MMGRTPDYVNVILMTCAAAGDFFEENHPGHGDNMARYYEYCRERDLCLTHTLVTPQANRSVGPSGQVEPFLALGIVEKRSEGMLVRGARMLATLAPFSDEIIVFPSTIVQTGGEEWRYSFAFAIPVATPGLRFICRESFDLERSHFDHPLGSRFEEMDAMAVFEDVLVPWQRLFMLYEVTPIVQTAAATCSTGPQRAPMAGIVSSTPATSSASAPPWATGSHAITARGIMRRVPAARASSKSARTSAVGGNTKSGSR